MDQRNLYLNHIAGAMTNQIENYKPYLTYEERLNLLWVGPIKIEEVIPTSPLGKEIRKYQAKF
jgi:hypothetical protein